MISLFKIKLFGLIILILSLVIGFSAAAGYFLSTVITSTHDQPTLLGSDFITGLSSNNRYKGWTDPVSVKPGDEFEVRVTVQNTAPDTLIKNPKVNASLPLVKVKSPIITGIISAENAATVSDTLIASIDGNSDYSLELVPGSIRVFSKNCPSGCTRSDNIVKEGAEVESLAFGETAQVLFKVTVR